MAGYCGTEAQQRMQTEAQNGVRFIAVTCQAKNAVSRLESSGLAYDNISIVSNNSDGRYADEHSHAAEGAGACAGVGALVGGAGGLLTGSGLMTIPGVCPVVAAGWLASTAAGAVTGVAVGGATGGITSAPTDNGVSKADAHFHAEGVRHGGTPVTARVDDVRYVEAEYILNGGPGSTERRDAVATNRTDGCVSIRQPTLTMPIRFRPSVLYPIV